MLNWNIQWQAPPASGVVASADATGGIGGSGSMRHHTNALANGGMMHTTGFSGAVGQDIAITAQMQVSTWGAPTVVNQSMLHLVVKNDANPYNGGIGGGLIFRDSGKYGIRDGDGMTGWSNRSELGLDNDPTVPGTSQWLTMELLLVDNAGVYDVTSTLYDGSNGILQQNTYSSALVVGSTLYAGFWNDWNLGGTGATIGTHQGVSEFQIDNFSVVAIPEPGTIGLSCALVFALLFLRHRSRR